MKPEAKPEAKRIAALCRADSPTLCALVIQLACLALTLVTAQMLDDLTVLQWAMVQGVLAALFSIGRLPYWWLPMQLFFPGAILFTLGLQLPSSLFLGCFVALLSVYGAVHRTRVPLYLTGRQVWDTVLLQLPPGPVKIIDVGSGIGGLCLHLAKERPQAEVTGVEIALLPWLLSRLRARANDAAVRFLRGDYATLDLAGFDVVFAYLSPAAMPALWQQAKAQMRPGSVLISHEFAIHHVSPSWVQSCPSGKLLYGWRM